MRAQQKHTTLFLLTRGTAAASLLLLASCATPSGPRSLSDSTVAVPETWQNTSEASVTRPAQTSAADNLSAWWTRYDDPVLTRLINGALQTSPDIRTALSKIEQSRATRGVTKSDLLPSLSAGADARTSRTKDHTTSPHTTTSGESYSASLDASWEIDLFGKNRQSLKAADADLAQTEQNFHAAQVSLAAEVATAYVSLRSAEAQLAVVEESLRTRAETTQITQWRAQSGDASALELQQAVSTLEQARASIPSLRQNIAQARNQLTRLSGLAPGALDQLLTQNTANAGTAYSSRIPKSDTPAVAIPADTLRQRPDIRAAEYAFAATVARLKAAERDRLPSLKLTGSLSLESLRAGDLFDPSTTVASALGSLTAPIFAGGRIKQNIAIQNELTKQSLIAYESAVLTALTDVENALVSIQRTTERITILDRANAAAREAAELAAIQYEAGQVYITTLLDAQRTELSIQEQQVSATADYTNAQIQLYKALGGGWGNVN
ncbi:multidrug efflux system outer membrane protein [Ereboglobus sp. PH5-10]|uniref:efflux transporter outer membrane subunit n=1 Tax=Ereboglobus sp. PH5-10 TaxID=2940629 RepID=UPI00240663DA|nr:TolC family protein [Ereboglobus sp. PH5-10]MDF9828136.1 multidrug efflux system outer membrane protein [Ereboglobus sp. PH5-10]